MLGQSAVGLGGLVALPFGAGVRCGNALAQRGPIQSVGVGDDALDGVGRRAGPVAVKVVRNIAHHRAPGQHIQVGKQHPLGIAKVLVANIAPAHNAGLVVGGERFVVHAPVGALKVKHIAQHFGPAQHKGVEQAHLNLGVGVQGVQQAVHSGGAAIVKQQAHTHAPISRGEQIAQQHQPAGIGPPDVVLHIQAVCGLLDQKMAGRKSLLWTVQGHDGGDALWRLGQLAQVAGCLAQRCVGSGGDGLAVAAPL